MDSWHTIATESTLLLYDLSSKLDEMRHRNGLTFLHGRQAMRPTVASLSKKLECTYCVIKSKSTVLRSNSS